MERTIEEGEREGRRSSLAEEQQEQGDDDRGKGRKGKERRE